MRILTGVALCFGLLSCSDDFLERAPLINLSDANFWKTENDLRVYANNFYNQDGLLGIMGTWSDSYYSFDEKNGSDTHVGGDYNRRMNGERTLPSSGGGWSSGDWGLLRNINYFMDHYHQAEVQWENIRQYVGEAHFFRSLFYFNKLRTFGGVPWTSTTVNVDSEALYAPRTPRNELVDSIMHDLDLAIEYLPARAGSAWSGRVTKETALALQARIALYEGTWERYHAKKNTPFMVSGLDGTKFIQKAADAAEALMDMAEVNGFPALDNVDVENGYWLLFNRKDYSNHKEVLLWRKFSIAEGVIHHYFGNQGGLSKSMVDSYLCLDGKPISLSPLYQGDKDLVTVIENRDPRLTQTMQVNDGKHILWDDRGGETIYFTTPGFSSPATGYQLYKGNHVDYAENANVQQSTAGVIYFRYAETLLIYAEAKTELGTVTQSDIDKTVNALRLRAGMKDGLLDMNRIVTDPNWEFSGISPLLQEVRRERKIELACEGFRVDDIFRWAAADELIAGKRPLGAIRKQWEDYPDASEEFVTAVDALGVTDDGYIDPYKYYEGMKSGYQFNLGRDYLSPIPTNEIVLNSKLTHIAVYELLIPSHSTD
jgi:hypothetical protein